MNMTDIAIRRPVMSWMVMGALIIFGLLSFSKMGISQMPDVDFPMISVSVSYPGAAPEIMETDVVDAVEGAVMSIEGVKSLTSTCRQGSARVSLEFGLNQNIDVAMQAVQAKLQQASRELPKGIDPPVISKSNPEDQPIIWLTVSSKTMPRSELMAYVRDVLQNKFTNVQGVGNVDLGGYVDPALRVWVNKQSLDQYSLTVADIVNSIQNEHVELPAGSITGAGKQFAVRTLGEAQSIGEFSHILINSRGGQPNYLPITLQQVAVVEQGLADVQRLSRANGQTAVGLGIIKQRGANAVEVSKQVRERLKRVQAELPTGVQLELRIDTTKFIEKAVEELLMTLVISVILTSIVCWLFLGTMSATFNVLLSIPTSIIGTFIVLHFAHFTLNIFTLMALSLAVGIVVDDSIMVLENIIRHNQKGKDKVKSAREGTKEVAFAALASTSAIVAIFLPVAFMSGIVGKYFFQFGVAIAVAVSLSLFEALTLTPMRCSQFVDTGEHTTFIGRIFDTGFNQLRRIYSTMLTGALRHRGWVVGLSMAFFVLSLISIRHLRSEFIPAQDQGYFMVRLKAKPGSSLEFTNRKTRLVEAQLMKNPVVEGYYATIGGYGGSDPSTAMINVTMKPLGHRGINPKTHKPWKQTDLMNSLRKQFKGQIKGCKLSIQDQSLRSFSTGMGFPVEFTIRGPNWDTLGATALAFQAAMDKNDLLTDVGTDYQPGMKEVQMIPNRALAASRGVSLTNIAQTIQSMIGGIKVSRFQSKGQRYDIIVKLPDKDLNEQTILNGLFVRNNRSELIPLSELVQVTKQPSLQSITRKDRERAITLYGNIKTGASQATVVKSIDQTAAQLLPAGYRLVWGGNSQASKESMTSLIAALGFGILVAYMILASLFNSYKNPLIILMALPFSASGAFLALLFTNQALSIYSMIGLILLMGLAVKNSILLVDFTNRIRAEGKRTDEALLEACPIRLRPILMTSIATIMGAVPAAMATGPGAETRIPMATAVIGGIIVSTLLTLFVVPSVYSLLNRKD